MAKILPIILEGENLGKRHHHLNTLVNNTYQAGIPFSSVRDVTEKSPLDRLFKIELASKYKNVEFIIENLKDPDMLYVSKALKSSWLLDPELSNIINPDYLEQSLYPEMTTTAVTKLKHLIQLHLKDPKRCEEFYQYYKVKDFDAAVKYLWNCSKEFVLSNVIEVLDKLTPFRLKLLSEKCPDVAKLFYEKLYDTKGTNKVLLKYSNEEKKYYENLRFLLKVNGDIFLDITEKSYDNNRFDRLSPEATKYIIRNHKNRFNNKPELYTAWLLDINTLAQCLSQQEIKDLILKLARAQYLYSWFTYRNVAPLIKRIDVAERSAFKKQVFVDNSFGDRVAKWPYDTPLPPVVKRTLKNTFEDNEHDPYEYEYLERPLYCVGGVRMVKKKKCAILQTQYLSCPIIQNRKTSLDQLFDRFRYASFEKTMFDLRKQMKVVSGHQRQNMMLVLVNKSGGRAESLEQFLNLLTNGHENEPENIRATVVRSLVRRCSVWRSPENVWEMVLKFGRGVGLDGTPSTVACSEGLHAVIIRNILLDSEISTPLWDAFLKDFSTLKQYSLNVAERRTISSKLPALLMAAAEKNPSAAVDLIEKALEVLEAYHIKPDGSLMQAIAAAARSKPEAASLLRRLFDARIARRELFKENFALIQNNASYLNALKHDVDIIASGEHFEKIIQSNDLAHLRFLRTLALYFNEDNGLAQKYLLLLKKHAEATPVNIYKLAHSITILAGDKFVDIVRQFNDVPKKSRERRFAVALRANAHLTRPLIDLDALGWQTMGAEAVANRIITCPTKEVDRNIQSLLAWSKSQRLAFVLSMRIGKEVAILQTICEKRPRLSLKTVLNHLKQNKLDENVWDIIIPTIAKLHSSDKINENLRKALSNVEIVPTNQKAIYCMTVYEVFRKVSRYAAMPMLCHIEHLLPEIDEVFIESLVLKFLNEEFTLKKLAKKDYTSDLCICLRIRIIAKYLLLCKTEADQETRWTNVGKPFLDRLDDIWKNWSKKSEIMEYFDEFLQSLKYSKVFLDTDYVSCLPIFELIINRLQSILPLHEYYDRYIRLHLTMLYFKSVRQAIKNNPDVFEDLPKKISQGSEIVGRMFGRYIAHEVIELTKTYFDSIRIVYRVVLLDYISNNFQYGESRAIFVKNVIKGILDSENNKPHLLAEYIYEDVHLLPIQEPIRKEIYQDLKGSKNIELNWNDLGRIFFKQMAVYPPLFSTTFLIFGFLIHIKR